MNVIVYKLVQTRAFLTYDCSMENYSKLEYSTVNMVLQSSPFKTWNVLQQITKISIITF